MLHMYILTYRGMWVHINTYSYSAPPKNDHDKTRRQDYTNKVIKFIVYSSFTTRHAYLCTCYRQTSIGLILSKKSLRVVVY